MSWLRNSSLMHKLLIGVSGVSAALLLMSSAQPDEVRLGPTTCQLDHIASAPVALEWVKSLLPAPDDKPNIIQ